MSKFKKIIILALFTFFVSILVSCFVDHFTILSISINLSDIQKTSTGDIIYVDSDSFKGENMGFKISRKSKLIKKVAKTLNNIFFIKECFATSVKEVYDNELLETSYKLCFDKTIIFNKDTIFAYTNLLDKLPYQIECLYKQPHLPEDNYIIFKEGIISEIEFENTVFKAYFSCLTKDGKELTAITEVIIENN